MVLVALLGARGPPPRSPLRAACPLKVGRANTWKRAPQLTRDPAADRGHLRSILELSAEGRGELQLQVEALTAERDALRSRVAELEATIDPLFDAAKKGPGHVID